MAKESSVTVGSGINPAKKIIPRNQTTGERHLLGVNTVCINPEDASAGGSGLVTAAVLTSSDVSQLPSTPFPYRRSIGIHNSDLEATVYIGFSPEIASGVGWPIGPGSSISMDINSEVIVYGISDRTSNQVRILELS
jgi:hypothetical protein